MLACGNEFGINTSRGCHGGQNQIEGIHPTMIYIRELPGYVVSNSQWFFIGGVGLMDRLPQYIYDITYLGLVLISE